MNYKQFSFFKKNIISKHSAQAFISIKADVYSIFFEKENERILVKDFKENIISGLKSANSNSGTYNIKAQIIKDDFELFSIVLYHHYKGYRFKYRSFYYYLCIGYLGLDKLLVNFRRAFGTIRQISYNVNKKNFITLERLDVLKLIAAKTIEHNDNFQSYSIGLVRLTAIKHGDFIFLAPGEKTNVIYGKYKLILDSLLESGDLKISRHNASCYEITGKAIKTLSDYEIEERRYSQMHNVSHMMFWATFTIAVATVINLITSCTQS